MWRFGGEPAIVYDDVDRSPLTAALIARLVELDPIDRVRRAIVEAFETITTADYVCLWELREDGFEATAVRGTPPEPYGADLERRLLALRGPTRSSLERHGDATLDGLSRRYRSEQRLCQVRPLRAFGELRGAVSFHVLRRAELKVGEQEALRRYADSAGFALRNAYAREELRRLAYTDTLTGLPNRRAVDDRLDDLENAPLSLLFIDLDGLKAVNDNVGYEEGDVVLRAAGTIIAAAARDRDLPGRLGGDEFVVLLPHTDAEDARNQGEALLDALDAIEPPASARGYFRGASVGWATRRPDETSRSLLRRATEQMRSIKRRRADLT